MVVKCFSENGEFVVWKPRLVVGWYNSSSLPAPLPPSLQVSTATAHGRTKVMSSRCFILEGQSTAFYSCSVTVFTRVVCFGGKVMEANGGDWFTSHCPLLSEIEILQLPHACIVHRVLLTFEWAVTTLQMISNIENSKRLKMLRNKWFIILYQLLLLSILIMYVINMYISNLTNGPAYL